MKERFVLVGTYKGDQLTKWRGWYNYPISDEELSRAEAQRRGENELVAICDRFVWGDSAKKNMGRNVKAIEI